MDKWDDFRKEKNIFYDHNDWIMKKPLFFKTSSFIQPRVTTIFFLSSAKVILSTHRIDKK